MDAADVPAARRIFSLAFGTFIGVPDPASFRADADYIGTRRRADPQAAFVLEADGELVGSNFATCWGSVGFFGPLTLHPDVWGQGLAGPLLEPVMERFEAWGVTHAGLFTFPHSTKHVHLYQKFGFWPRHLTGIMVKPVQAPGEAPEWSRFPGDGNGAAGMLESLASLSDSIHPGLRVDREILAVAEQGLGETVILMRDGELDAFAVCHCGAGTEAGAGNCFVKFGAARPGAAAPERFADLLRACEDLAAQRGLERLMAGVNLSRHEAAACMLETGFKAVTLGISMHRPDEPAYSRSGAFVIDDWR